MFTRLRLKNFKIWGEQLWDGVDLAPITLVLGTNSAGKTSLLQPLLLLRQTFASTDRSLDLYLGGKKGDLIDLGTFEQVIHDNDTKRRLGFGFTLEGVERKVLPAKRRGGGDEAPAERVAGRLEYEATYKVSGGAVCLEKLKMAHEDLRLEATRGAKGGYRLAAPGYAARKRQDGHEVATQKFRPEKSLAFSDAARLAIGGSRHGVEDLSLGIASAFERIQYLGPLRERPQPTYLWGGQEPGELGSRGEDAVLALLANLNATKKSDRGRVVERVSHWLREMGVADELQVEQVGGSRFYEVMLVSGGKKANLVHVGFGVSQVLPMIVLAETAPEGSTIIAEQPEIHLHPRAQTALANLMVDASRRRGLQFLVETHSEHLFRRLQFLVADEQIAPEECRLYFVSRDDAGAARLEALHLDAYGRIDNWPEDFFGDALGETERQMERIFDRMTGERGEPGDGG